MRLASTVLHLCGIASSAIAQPSVPREQPDSVVRAFLRAVEEERWYDATEFIELGRFEAELASTIEFARRPRMAPPPMTVDDMRRHDPDMPREVAEYQLKRLQRQLEDTRAHLRYQFADIPSVDSLSRLTLRQVAARRLEARDERYLLRLQLAEGNNGCSAEHGAALLREHAPVPATILGSIVRDDVAYVLVEAPTRAAARVDELAAMATPSVIRVVRWGSQWRIRDWERWRGNDGGFALSCITDQSVR